MKRFFLALLVAVVCSATHYCEAQNVQIVSNNDFHKYGGAVRRLQLDFCFDDYQHHTYWYDERGSLVQYVEVLRQGSSTLRSIDTLIIQGGRVVQQRHYSYSGGSPSGSKVTKPGSSFSMPIYQIPPYYYVVASSLDGAGNWTKALYSHGDNSRYVSRKFEYAGGVSSRTQAEFEHIAALTTTPSKPAATPATSSTKQSASAKKSSPSATPAKQNTSAKAAESAESAVSVDKKSVTAVESKSLSFGTITVGVHDALRSAYWTLAWILLVVCGLAIWNWWSISNWFNCEARRTVVPESFLNRKIFIALIMAAVTYYAMHFVVALGADRLNTYDYSLWWVEYGVYAVVVLLSFIPAYLLLLVRRLVKALSIGATAAKWEFRYVVLLSFMIFSVSLLVLALAIIVAIFLGGASSKGSSRGGGRRGGGDDELTVDERCARGLCSGCQYYVNGHWCSRYGGEADQCSQEEKY